MAKVSKYFSDQETKVSAEAVRRGLDNTPPAILMPNVHKTAEYMDKIREMLEHPVTVLSWYRSPEVNRSVGGSATSAHVAGLAVDFICPGYGTPLEVAKAIKASGMPFDQLIHEFQEWVHIGFKEHMTDFRDECLTATKVNKKTVYTKGLK